MRVHYNHTFYNQADIKAAAKIYYNALPGDVNVLVSMGNSGCSIATAMLMLAGRLGASAGARTLCHVSFRKNQAEVGLSHSDTSGYRTTLYDEDTRIAIVDDFIVAGETMDRIWEQLKLERCRDKIAIIIVSYCEDKIESWAEQPEWAQLVWCVESGKAKQEVTKPKIVESDANWGSSPLDI